MAFATSGESSSQQAVNQLGRSAAVYLGCTGTKGRTNTNSIHGVTAGSFLSAGEGTTSVSGNLTSGIARATSTSTISDVNLLGGLVRAQEVRAVATSTYDTATGTASSSFAGSGLVGLKIGGLPVNRSIAPNTRINLPLIGYVILNKQTMRQAAGGVITQVSMIEVHVTTANALNLPVGSDLLVAVAKSRVLPF
jgi:hypothetical protein